MKTKQRIAFVPHGIRWSVNGVHIDSYTNSESRAMALVHTRTSTDDPYTPHDAGNEIIELAERIKSERAIMGMK